MEDSPTDSPVTAAVYAPIGEKALVSRIRQRLEDAIATGVLAPGDRLPGESALAARFRVSLVTVREALQQLRATDLLYTKQGRGGGSFVAMDSNHARDLLQRRIGALSRAEITDFATYYRAIVDAVLRTIDSMGLEHNLMAVRETFLRASPSDGAAARSVQGGLDLRLAGESQSVRLVHEQIRIQNEFGALLWMGLDDEELRQSIFTHNEHMLDEMIAGATDAAIRAREEAVTISLRWLLSKRNDAQRHERENIR
ncbi:GntR family transcriptional regulator [Brevibacterium marinum]|uniref:DNA-binding GntR family transcriptional regulator n=1 Tax=Brevibacterium marinum TaxID=418643 RepID=A0A846RYE0_9MICO|nr:GntR family transcriptional regulator [Brevibacterium marinum]NJC56455.1 DNA-binding GntR family transcriptional regulator [Brevibacterium marinum]